MDLEGSLSTLSNFFSAKILKEIDEIKSTLKQIQIKTEDEIISLKQIQIKTENEVISFNSKIDDVKEHIVEIKALVQKNNTENERNEETVTNTHLQSSVFGKNNNTTLEEITQEVSNLFTNFGENNHSVENNPTTTAENRAITNTAVNRDDCIIKERFKNDQLRADHIAKLVEDKFASFKIVTETQRRIIAGVVMTRDDVVSDTEIISVTMGTKCIFGKNLSWNGKAVNDMHAEIMSRRCLIKYFYDQLDLAINSQERSSIFILNEGGKKYRLKKGIQFHLYVNLCPCGDAVRPVKGQFVGFLRMKIESEEGNVPVRTNMKQSWQRLLNGDRLLTMSCSDKICRWNVVGLQGALLSHFLEPIYLESIVIGNESENNLQNVRRALYGRIETSLENLPIPYRLNRPSIFFSVPRKALPFGSLLPSAAFNWSIGNNNRFEKVGIPLLGVSKYCKREFFKRFFKLLRKFSGTTVSVNDRHISYYSAKESAHSYKLAKERFCEAFEKAGLGYWVSKPIEHDTFELTSDEIEDFLA